MSKTVVIIQVPESKKINYILKKIADVILSIINRLDNITLQDGSIAKISNRLPVQIFYDNVHITDRKKIIPYINQRRFGDHHYWTGYYHTTIIDPDTIKQKESSDCYQWYSRALNINFNKNSNIILVDNKNLFSITERQCFNNIKYAYEIYPYINIKDLPFCDIPGVRMHKILYKGSNFLDNYSLMQSFRMKDCYQTLVYYDSKDTHIDSAHYINKITVIVQSEIPIYENPLCSCCRVEIYNYFYISVNAAPDIYCSLCAHAYYQIYGGNKKYIIGKSTLNLDKRQWKNPDLHKLYNLVCGYSGLNTIDTHFVQFLFPGYSLLLIKLTDLLNDKQEVVRLCKNYRIKDLGIIVTEN